MNLTKKKPPCSGFFTLTYPPHNKMKLYKVMIRTQTPIFPPNTNNIRLYNNRSSDQH